MLLKTERMTLRNFREADAERVTAWRNDPRCSRYQRWEHTSLAAARRQLEESGKDVFLSKKEEQHYALCMGDSLAGELAYFYTEKDHCVTLGITIAPEFQRRGCGYEILQAVVRAIRETLPELDIVALIERENRASIALLEKLVFFRECCAQSIASYVYVLNAGNTESL